MPEQRVCNTNKTSKQQAQARQQPLVKCSVACTTWSGFNVCSVLMYIQYIFIESCTWNVQDLKNKCVQIYHIFVFLCYSMHLNAVCLCSNYLRAYILLQVYSSNNGCNCRAYILRSCAICPRVTQSYSRWDLSSVKLWRFRISLPFIWGMSCVRSEKKRAKWSAERLIYKKDRKSTKQCIE